MIEIAVKNHIEKNSLTYDMNKNNKVIQGQCIQVNAVAEWRTTTVNQVCISFHKYKYFRQSFQAGWHISRFTWIKNKHNLFRRIKYLLMS